MNTEVLTTLAGVVIGSGGVILAQTSTNRSSERQAKAQRADARLSYQRALLREFLEEAQKVESHVVKACNYQLRPPDQALDQLWMLQKYVTLTIPVIQESTFQYVDRLSHLAWNGMPDDGEYRDVWAAMNGPRGRFLEDAGAAVNVDLRDHNRR